MSFQAVCEAFWLNLRLLQFETPAHGSFGPHMFRTPNEAGMLTLIHFLITRLEGCREASAVAARWPCLHDRRETTAFKKAASAAIATLAADGSLPRECTRGSILSTARGPAAELLVFHLSTLALVQSAERHPVLANDAANSPAVATTFDRLRTNEGWMLTKQNEGYGSASQSSEKHLVSFVNAARARVLAEVARFEEFQRHVQATEAEWREMQQEVSEALAAARTAQAKAAEEQRQAQGKAKGGGYEHPASFLLTHETEQIERSRRMTAARKLLNELAIAVAEEEGEECWAGEARDAATSSTASPAKNLSRTVGGLVRASTAAKPIDLTEECESGRGARPPTTVQSPLVWRPRLLKSCIAAIARSEERCAEARMRVCAGIDETANDWAGSRANARIDTALHRLRRSLTADFDGAVATAKRAEARYDTLLQAAAADVTALRAALKNRERGDAELGATVAI